MTIIAVLFSLEFPYLTDSEETMHILKNTAFIVAIVAFGLFGAWWQWYRSPSADPHFPHVKTEHMILCCSDPRIQESVQQWRKKRFGDYADLIAWPGVTPSFHHKSQDVREWAVEQIRTLQRLHGFHTLHVLSHHDCGGHGGFERHGSMDEEKRYHREDLEKTKATIRLHLPDLEIHLYYVDAQGVHLLEL